MNRLFATRPEVTARIVLSKGLQRPLAFECQTVKTKARGMIRNVRNVFVLDRYYFSANIALEHIR